MAASTFVPTAGSVGIAKFGTDTVPGINWTLLVDGKVMDVSNFRDGRFRVDTLHDSTVNITLVWDSADQPTDSAGLNVKPGATGDVKLYTDATHYFSVPFIVATIGPKNDGPESVVMVDVTLNQSGQTGNPFAYPLPPS